MSRLVLSLLLVAGCTKTNPYVCCETEAECASHGFTEPAPCEVGVCVANQCVDTGCDGAEDCTDSAFPICEAGSCVATPPPPPRVIPGCNASGDTRILFVSDRDGDEDIWAMTSDGSSPTELTNNMTPDRNPHPSPDGSAIAYLGEGTLVRRDVFVADRFGENAVNASDNDDADRDVEWSPDGTMIAVDASTGGYLIRGDGSERQDVVTATNVINSQLSWSPDSARVVFSASRSLPIYFGIYTVKRNATDLQSVYTDPAGRPRWSPDGRAFVFEATTSDTIPPPTWLELVDDVTQRALTHFTTGGNSKDPVWSRDGMLVAFVHDGDIWTVQRVGGNQKNLTMNAQGNAHPRWSPDGKQILYEGMSNGKRDIFVMNADGSNPTNLTNNAGDDSSAEWGKCP